MIRRTILAVALISICWNVAGAEPPITAVAFGPGGSTVLAASQKGVAVYEWPALTLARSLDGDFSSLHDLAFSPDGSRLAVAGGNPGEAGLVTILSWPEGKLAAQLDGHTDVVYDVDWNPSATQLLTAGLDQQAVLWNVADGKPVQRFPGHSRGVTALELLAGETMLVTAALDQNLHVREIDSGRLVRTLNNHTGPVHDLAAQPGNAENALLVSVSDDRTVRFWQPTIGRMVRFVRLDSTPLAAAWIPGKPIVAVATSAGTIVLIDAATASIKREIAVSAAWLYSLAASSDGEYVAAGDQAGRMHRTRVEPE